MLRKKKKHLFERIDIKHTYIYIYINLYILYTVVQLLHVAPENPDYILITAVNARCIQGSWTRRTRTKKDGRSDTPKSTLVQVKEMTRDNQEKRNETIRTVRLSVEFIRFPRRVFTGSVKHRC